MSVSPLSPPHRATFAMWVEYDGTDFAGWQAQAGQPSIAGALSDALAKMTGQTVPIGCAGRTDAGVHARAQLAHFTLATGGGLPSLSALTSPRRFAPGLNHFLPHSIRVHRSWGVPDGFVARRAAAGKQYRYRIYCGPHPAPLERHRVWHVRRHLDVAAMQAAAHDLVGTHDFEAFRHAHCEAHHARRRLRRISCTSRRRPPTGELITIAVVGDAFCRHMCRIIAGTLMEVGAGLRPADSMPKLLLGRERRRTGITAPAAGLTLWRVYLGRRRAGPAQHIP